MAEEKNASMLTPEEVLNIIKEKVSNHEFGYDDFYSVELGLGECVEVTTHGGEDQGSEWYVVRHFVEPNVYVRLDGYYSSYNGTDFNDDPYLVTPKEVTITVYE